MNENEQVQEMAKELFEYGIEYDPYIIGYEGDIAKHLHSKGYRKATQAKWLMAGNTGICSNCNRQDTLDNLACYCRYCGADMRGDTNGS